MIDLLGSKVAAQSLVDVIAERLEAAITSGNLAPGTKISEQALAKSLGVSRGPFREAVRRLEGRKLVHRTPNIGVRVTQLSKKDLTDLLIVREALEGMACRAAAEKMSEADIKGLSELLLAHRKHTIFQAGMGYYQETKELDFHYRIVKASKNDRLISILCDDLYHLLRVYRYKSSTRRGRAEQAFDEHCQIVAALGSRDPDLAELKMREHIRNVRRDVENDSVDGPAGGSPMVSEILGDPNPAEDSSMMQVNARGLLPPGDAR